MTIRPKIVTIKDSSIIGSATSVQVLEDGTFCFALPIMLVQIGPGFLQGTAVAFGAAQGPCLVSAHGARLVPAAMPREVHVYGGTYDDHLSSYNKETTRNLDKLNSC